MKLPGLPALLREIDPEQIQFSPVNLHRVRKPDSAFFREFEELEIRLRAQPFNLPVFRGAFLVKFSFRRCERIDRSPVRSLRLTHPLSHRAAVMGKTGEDIGKLDILLPREFAQFFHSREHVDGLQFFDFRVFLRNRFFQFGLSRRPRLTGPSRNLSAELQRHSERSKNQNAFFHTGISVFSDFTAQKRKSKFIFSQIAEKFPHGRKTARVLLPGHADADIFPFAKTEKACYIIIL